MSGQIRRAVLVLTILAAAASSLHAWGVRENRVYPVPKTASAPVIIVPGSNVGPVTLDMTKDQVVRTLGRPDAIFYGDTAYSLRDAPLAAYYVFGKAGLSVFLQSGKVRSISVLSEQYQFPGAIRVGMNVTQTEKALGKMPENDYTEIRAGHPETVRRDHEVFITAGTTYRLAFYPDKGLTLKVNVDTGRIMEMRVSAPGMPESIGPIPNIEAQIAEKNAAASRFNDERKARDIAIALDRYALLDYGWDIRTPENKSTDEGSQPERHFYLLRNASDDQGKARAAAFLASLDSFDSKAPSVRDVVTRFGLPTSFELLVDPQGVRTLDMLWYGTQFIGVNGIYDTLEQVPLYGAYRYKGKIGAGSTEQEVVALLGKAPADGLQMLLKAGWSFATSDGRSPKPTLVYYPEPGCMLWFVDGKVTTFTRVWLQH